MIVWASINRVMLFDSLYHDITSRPEISPKTLVVKEYVSVQDYTTLGFVHETSLFFRWRAIKSIERIMFFLASYQQLKKRLGTPLPELNILEKDVATTGYIFSWQNVERWWFQRGCNKNWRCWDQDGVHPSTRIFLYCWRTWKRF